jgi:hypothetical protein
MLDPESNLVNKLQAPEPVDFTCLVPPRGDMSLLFVVLIIFIALVFHDTNGMHDVQALSPRLSPRRFFRPGERSSGRPFSIL